MKKLVIITLSLLLFIMSTPTYAEGDIPAGAQKFADEFFLDIVKEQLKSHNSSNFNLNPDSENITFGPLHQVYTMNQEFVQNSKSDPDKGVVLSGEYIATVYQDGKPVNAIGTYQNEAGEFALSSFGYSYDLAKKLDKLKGNEKIIYEFPQDAWYLFNDKKVKPLTESAIKLMKEEKDLAEFQKVINERYKNVKNVDNTSGGGYGEITDGETMGMISNNILYSVIAILGVACLLLLINNRKIKNKYLE